MVLRVNVTTPRPRSGEYISGCSLSCRPKKSTHPQPIGKELGGAHSRPIIKSEAYPGGLTLINRFALNYTFDALRGAKAVQKG
jgi:hypothetical protein